MKVTKEDFKAFCIFSFQVAVILLTITVVVNVAAYAWVLIGLPACILWGIRWCYRYAVEQYKARHHLATE